MKFFTIIIFLSVLFISSNAFAEDVLPPEDRKSIDSLTKIVEITGTPDTVRANALNNIGKIYMQYRETRDSAFMRFNESLIYSNKINFRRGVASALYSLGKICIYFEDSENAIKKFNNAKTIYLFINDEKGVADCYLQFGVMMFVQTNFKAAIDNFHIALPTYLKLNDSARFSTIQYLIGLSQCELCNYNEALQNLQAALNTKMNLKDEIASNECRIGIGKVFYNTGQLDDALIYFRKAKEYFGSNTFSPANLWIYIGIGNILLQKQQLADAEVYFTKANEILFANPSIKNWYRSQVYKPLYLYYEQKGDLKKSFQFLKLYAHSRDSIYNEDNLQQMVELESVRGIAEENKKVLLLQEKENYTKNLLISLFIILALVIVVLLGIWRRSRLRLKLNRQLAEKNQALDKSLHSLEAAEQQLIKSEKMAVFGKLSAGIAHEIRNPLNFITNFSELSQQMMDDFVHTEDEKERQELAEQIKKLVDKIGYHGRRADSIVTRMLQHSRSAHTDLEFTDVNRICDEFSDLAYQSTRNMITNFECKLEKKLDPEVPKVWLVPQDLSRVVINLLNNAFYAVHDKKHLQLNGYQPEVTITTSHDDKNVIIAIHDNGAGIPQEAQAKIFEPFYTTKPIGDGTGLGLSICADIVKAASGDILVKSSAETGTTFEVRFPIETPIELAN